MMLLTISKNTINVSNVVITLGNLNTIPEGKEDDGRVTLIGKKRTRWVHLME